MPRISSSSSFEHKKVRVGGASLHYVEHPTEGPPMVLLHGIGMDWRVWQAILRRLRTHFHVFMVDLRGHGESSKPAHGYSLAEYAADIEDLIDMLGLEQTIVVGSSLGGMVTAAIEAPADVVSHRVLVDPPLTGGPIRDEAMFRDILRLKQEPYPVLADYLTRLNPGVGRNVVRMMAEMWQDAADGVITDMLADREHYYFLDKALVLNEAPTLIMRADPRYGGVLSYEQALRSARMLEQGHVVDFPGAGHAIHASQPETFVETILDFVRGR